MDVERFWKDLGRILKVFQVAELTLMIRATRSRSSRPNHMPSHLDALQTTSSVNLRRFVGNFHSVAKQASLSVASQSDFGGFSEDLGRVGEAKNGYQNLFV